MSKNLYVAKYWKNDGDWHESWDYDPTFSFYAESDEQAQQLAIDYIRLNTQEFYDFSLSHLARINLEIQEIPFQENKKKITRVERIDARHSLERKLQRANFVDIREAIFPPKK